MGSVSRHVVFADLHIPFADAEAVDAAHRVAKASKPDTIWLLGDILDFAPISRFRDAKRYRHTVQDEIDQAVDYLKRLRREFPDAAIHWKRGNHELRLRHYLWTTGREIEDLRSLRLERQFRIDKNDNPLDLGVTFHSEPVTFAKRSFVLKHGNRACLYATRWECDDEGRSGISGHIHRSGMWSWSTPGGGPRVWHTVGCLCALDPMYAEPGQVFHWNHGCAVLTVSDRHVDVENIIIDGGVAAWRGRRL